MSATSTPAPHVVSNEAIQRQMIANALFREQLRVMSLSARYGGSDATKGVAVLMHAALEKRKDEIIAEVVK